MKHPEPVIMPSLQIAESPSVPRTRTAVIGGSPPQVVEVEEGKSLPRVLSGKPIATQDVVIGGSPPQIVRVPVREQ